MERIKQYLLTRKVEILTESNEINGAGGLGYHNQGHLDIISEFEAKISEGADIDEINKFACSEIKKSEDFIEKEDSEYAKLSEEDMIAYEFTPEYFIRDGRMCQCIELQTFMDEE